MGLNDRMKRILRFSNILIIITSFFLAENLTGAQGLSEVVKSYYSQRFNIHSKDIKIKFIHVPDVDTEKQYLVVPELKIKLGHQTIWIEEYISGDTFPLTLDISANIPVLVAKKTISRKEGLGPEMFDIKSCLLTRDYERYLFDVGHGVVPLGLSQTQDEVYRGATLIAIFSGDQIIWIYINFVT